MAARPKPTSTYEKPPEAHNNDYTSRDYFRTSMPTYSSEFINIFKCYL